MDAAVTGRVRAIHYADGVDQWCPVTGTVTRTAPGDATCPECGPVAPQIVPLIDTPQPPKDQP